MSDKDMNRLAPSDLKSSNSSDISGEEQKRKRESQNKSPYVGINIITNSNVHEKKYPIIQRDLPDADNISILPDESESNDGLSLDGNKKSFADLNENVNGFNDSHRGSPGPKMGNIPKMSPQGDHKKGKFFPP
jgi:hypothetical protein